MENAKTTIKNSYVNLQITIVNHTAIWHFICFGSLYSAVKIMNPILLNRQPTAFPHRSRHSWDIISWDKLSCFLFISVRVFWYNHIITTFFIIKPTRCIHFTNFFGTKLYTFRTVPLSIISLFTVHSALVYVIQVWKQLSSRARMELHFHPGPLRKLSTNIYYI